MKDKILKIISSIIFLLLALVFIAKLGGPGILKLYIETGMGDCQKSPILCIRPESEIINPRINEEYLTDLAQYNFGEIQIRLPKEFTVVKEKVTKTYYKKNKDKHRGSVVYLLYEQPDFFVNLFPQTKKQGIKNDYEFFNRLMYARIPEIKNLTDTFFVIMKGVFTPDVGEQINVKMSKFIIQDKSGFITYNLSLKGNYFDCNIFDSQGNFFKAYIKDKDAVLNLEKVITIVSSVKKSD